jgi:multiple antibiotic resistance protein
MVLDPDDSGDEPPKGADPIRLAAYPLAVPYLLNPVGIVVLVTISAEARPFGLLAIVLGLTAVVIAIDAMVFGIATRIESINETRMLVIEKVFGFLLAALAVQLILDALGDLGVLHLPGH